MARLRAAALAAALLAAGAAAEKRRALGCTAIAVDGAATKDGSAFAGMNADCSSCDPRITYVPGGEHKEGAKRPLYIFSGGAPRFVGYGRGKFYEPKDGEKLSPVMGEIPQARKTYAYWEGVLPLMNEAGLAMGESSCAARLLNYPRGTAPAVDPRTGGKPIEALLDLSNLMQIAMERCATARCAVKLMGELSEEYGFCPMVDEWSLGQEADGKTAFDDGGEALTLSDRTGEAWIFHVAGGVPNVTKSVWAAMRVPNGHAAFIANNWILREVPEQESEDWLFSPKLREAALAAGLWDGKEPLDWTKTFAPDSVTFESPPGEAPIPLYASLRLWRLFGIAAPGAWAARELPVDPLVIPPTVQVEKTMGHQDVFEFLSDLYEGTEFDLTQGILAGPFGNPFHSEGGNATRFLGQIPRGISISRTSYSTIGQSRREEESLVWFAADTPATSVYVPFYAAAGDHHAKSYSTGTLHKFTRESAWWAFDFVANWASMAHWRNASGQFIRPLRSQLHAEIQEEMPKAEAKAKKEGRHKLAEWQAEVQQRVVDRWWKLADELVVAYNDGFYNDAKANRLGLSLGYPEWFAKQVGFNQDVHPIFVQRVGEVQELFSADPSLAPPGFRQPISPLPGQYDKASATWEYGTAPTEMVGSGAARTLGVDTAGVALQAATALLTLSLGVFIGRAYERRTTSRPDSYQPLP